MKIIHKYKIVFALIFSLSVLLLSALNFKEYIPIVNAGNCGINQPDAQIWGNCYVPPYSGCRADPSQGTEGGGWTSGGSTTAHHWLTDAANPISMEFQCFQNLSIGIGGINPVHMELKNSSGVTVAERWRAGPGGAGNPDELKAQLPVDGTYTFRCYALAAGTCLADSETFTIYPRACIPSAPGAPILISPADGAVVQVNSNTSQSVALNYDVASTGWGKACPNNNNTYNLEVGQYINGTCVNWSNRGNATSTLPGSTGQAYCWRVTKNNGSQSVTSPVRVFYTVDDRAYYYTGQTKIAADVCGSGWSGNSKYAGVSNPIDFNFSVNTYSENYIREAWLAAVPDTGLNDIETEASILAKAKAGNGFVFKLISNTPNTTPVTGVVSSAQAYNGVGWNSVSANAGNVSGLGATLLNVISSHFGTNASMIAATEYRTSNFRVQLDTVPYGRYAFYWATILTDNAGHLFGSYDEVSQGPPYVFKRVTNPYGSLTNWGIDLTPPVAGAFKSKAIANDTFQINWAFTENNGLQLKSFVTTDNPASSLRDASAGGGNIDFSVPLPNTTNFATGALQFIDVPAGNAYVTQNSLGLRTYVDADPSLQSNYVFYGLAKDNACNQVVVSTSSIAQSPWVSSYNGDISASQGVTGLTIPSGLDQLSEPLKNGLGATLLSDLQSTFLSTYSAITGNASMPLRKQSKLQQYVTNYKDLSINPPPDSGSSDWYGYMYNIVTANAAAPIDVSTYGLASANPNPTILKGKTTSSFLGVAAGTKKHVVIAGNLTLQQDVVCDTQTIFFVGGKVSITPNFTVSGLTNGCIFVSKLDVTIANVPGRVNGSGLVDATALASYDLIEAAIFTNANLITQKDVPNAAQKGFGLMIKGSVATNDLTLKRDINLNANQLQPAQVFYFDPRYREIFKADINFNKYSLREIGYTSN